MYKLGIMHHSNPALTVHKAPHKIVLRNMRDLGPFSQEETRALSVGNSSAHAAPGNLRIHRLQCLEAGS